MENLIRKYGLVAKTGRYTPESEQRRDVLASLLTDEGEVPPDMTTAQWYDWAEKKYKERGLPIPPARDIHLSKERVRLRFVAQWIAHPEQRKPREAIPGYLRTQWELLQQQFPFNGTAPLIEAPAQDTPPEPPPSVAEEETPLADPIRVLAEGHAKIFSMLAGEYEKLFGAILRRLDKLENAGLAKRAPPAIPTNVSEALPEATRRYFEYEMPEKTDYGLVIRYTERFRRSYKKMPDGLHWQVAKAMEQLATKGMRYPALGFKRLGMQSKQSVLDRPECRTYHFRVQRTWRIIVNVDNVSKIIWVEVAASHNDKQFYER